MTLKEALGEENEYQRLYTLPRNNISLAILLKNETYIPPQEEDIIVGCMIQHIDTADYPELIEKFKVSKRMLQNLRKKYNLPTIKKKYVMSFQNILKISGERKCPRCNETKKLDTEWYNNNLSRCIKCEKELGKIKHKENQKKEILSLDAFINKKIKESKQRKNIESIITTEEVVDVFNKQNGKCYYTNYPLEISHRNKTPYSLSIDRIDSNKGYTIDNIVLCCSIVNRMKMDDDVNHFIQLCKDISHKHSI
jgi:hypothetical protein